MTIEVGARYNIKAGIIASVVGKLPTEKRKFKYVAIVLLNSGNSYVEYYDEKGRSKTGQANLTSVLTEAS